ncbi:uncharacterized protein [Narcine bancroftii]|uniref:uncharacterized protein isoform X1 n=1 Tax=Narcine bancroftii TaxID=1343680 RepID=UPI0038310874
MRTRFLYRRLTASMMLSFFVFLHQPVSALENINLVFFVDNKDNIELKAPAYNGVGRLVWEWKPHSRKEIQKLWTFHWIKRYGRWRKERNYWENQALYQNIINNRGTFNLKVIKPAFKFAGLFTLTQTEPKNQILKQYELFGIRVEASSKRPMAGTDIILSCSISRLPDTVSLHWKQKGSSQLNRRNVEQICLNNTAYLMVRHVAEEDKNLFECEVQENGSRLYTEGVNLLLDNDTAVRMKEKGWSHIQRIKRAAEPQTTDLENPPSTWRAVLHPDLKVTLRREKVFICSIPALRHRGINTALDKKDCCIGECIKQEDAYWKKWTLFRSSTDYDELHLNLKYASCIYFFHLLKGAASATINNPIIVNSANFGNRMVTSVKYFRLNIVPVLFEDAGDYTCYCNQVPYTSIHLITVKVTAEPPDPLTEEDTVTLTCSVSELAESMRLVWINSIAKTAREMRATAKEKSVRLTIHKFERGRGDWRCGLFTKNVPQLLVPYYLKPSGSENSIYFFHQEGYFVLNGPVNPGIGSIVWEWRPHSAQQTTRRLATFHRNSQWWTVQWNDEYQKTQGISQRIRVDWGTLNMRIRKPTFELAGLFTWNQIHAGGKILREWEVFGIKGELDKE